MSEKPERRIAIIGTAPTYIETPWDDPTLEKWALNDMWVLDIPHADRWFDLHPVEKMYFHDRTKKKLPSHQVPAGFFVRPKGHLEWLAKQTIPVYMQQAIPSIPASVTFPREAIEAKFGANFASSPAWMIGLALLEGVTELHVYGIHLATEWEYLKQKPNMAFLLGLAAGLGVKVVIPKGAPLLKESHRYAFEEDPDLPQVAAQRTVERLQAERDAVQQRGARTWYQWPDRNVASRLAWLEAQITDAKLGVMHATAGRTPAGW